jgi:acetylglutamate kinase
MDSPDETSAPASRATSFFSKPSKSIPSSSTAAARPSPARWKSRLEGEFHPGPARHRRSHGENRGRRFVARNQSRSRQNHQFARRQAGGLCRPDIFKCKKLFLDDKENPGKKIDIGYVGEVIEVNVAPLKESMWCGFTPVISPTARGEDGKIYNCNADVAAAMCAIALNAKRLVFMSDVPGLMRDPKDPDRHRAFANRRSSALKAAGIVDKGMIPKVDSAVAAIKSGVEKVSFVDGRVPHSRHAGNFHRQGRGHGNRVVIYDLRFTINVRK